MSSLRRDTKFTTDQAHSARLSMPNEKDLHNIFNAYDRDQDGVLQPEELIEVFRGLGLNPTKEECRDFIKDYGNKRDNNSNNVEDEGEQVVLDFNEFQELLTCYFVRGAENRIVEAFRILDKNKNGYLEFREIRNYLMNFGDDRLTENEIVEMVTSMIEQADLDFDYHVDYYEFAKVLSEAVIQHNKGK